MFFGIYYDMAKYRIVNCKLVPKINFKKIILKITALLIAVSLLLFLYINLFVSPLVKKVAAAKAKSEIVNILESAIYQATLNNINYDDLVNIKFDSEGTVSLLEYAVLKVNQTAYQVSVLIQEKLNSKTNSYVSFPSGVLTGIPFLSQLGSSVAAKIEHIGNVTCRFHSEFTSSGINQTRHRIYLEYKTTLILLLPLISEEIILSNQLLVSEAVIVGKIPTTYLQTLDTGNMFDLVPN